MTWNYRVIKRLADNVGEVSAYYRIHEVYYDEKGRPTSWTENCIEPIGDSPKELEEDLRLMLKALREPVLVEENGKLVERK